MGCARTLVEMPPNFGVVSTVWGAGWITATLGCIYGQRRWAGSFHSHFILGRVLAATQATLPALMTYRCYRVEAAVVALVTLAMYLHAGDTCIVVHPLAVANQSTIVFRSIQRQKFIQSSSFR